MYLEISSRQSGKTERMLKHALKQINKGKRVLFVTLNQTMSRFIYERLRQMGGCDKKIPITFTTYKAFIDSCYGFDYYYFDDFDFGDIKQKDVEFFIVTNAYYTTTARFVRTNEYLMNLKHTGTWDLLVELMRYKRSKYKSYRNRSIKPMITNYQTFSREYCGSWKTNMLGNLEFPAIPNHQIVLDLIRY